ncbi:endonuclease/exonuclease/phosphatase family protein [Actinokineospora enzanensis]|uniref:endonuclease/exonuclease/phosphatase family protein n=1 Tax=Actinokineospora enzanensis TaxID=155975 RepID=UPI00036DC4D8|nr:endonuclease/exonuclease/phosphatase family protein [Actinokineospora enzanensis]
MTESALAYDDYGDRGDYGGDQEAAPPRRRRRRGVTVFLALLVVLLFAVCVLRLGSVDGNFITVGVLALTPYIAGYGLVVALLALVLRRKVLFVLALVGALSLGVLLVPRLLPDGDPIPGGQRVRLLSANLMIGRADPAALVSLVRDARVDVLTLQELTPESMNALDAAGIDRLLPYRVVRALPGSAGSAILARVPLRQIVLVDDPVLENPAAVVDLSGSVDIEVVSVHTVPPVMSDGDRKRWQNEILSLPGPDSTGRPRVLAGDFNATLDHGALNGLLDRGYRDGAELVGEGLRPTWVSPRGYLPPVTIDHVLVDKRIGVTTVSVYSLPGSDHNAVFSELALPR